MFFQSKKKAKLIEWQNLLLSNPSSKLTISEEKLRTATKARIENDLRIVNDSSTIIQSTIKPDVFFERLHLLTEHLSSAAKFEPYISFNSVKPSEALSKTRLEKQKIIFEFLKRYFISVLNKIDTLKTDKGKANQLKKFYDSLEKYKCEMNAENVNYYTQMYNTYIKDYIKE